jgi:hypothetical protein
MTWLQKALLFSCLWTVLAVKGDLVIAMMLTDNSAAHQIKDPIQRYLKERDPDLAVVGPMAERIAPIAGMVWVAGVVAIWVLCHQRRHLVARPDAAPAPAGQGDDR